MKKIIIVGGITLAVVLCCIFARCYINKKLMFGISKSTEEISAEVELTTYIAFTKDIFEPFKDRTDAEKRAYILGILLSDVCRWENMRGFIEWDCGHIKNEEAIKMSEKTYTKDGKTLLIMPEKTYTIDNFPLQDDCLPHKEGETKYCYITYY